jgi:hypothetical protein
MGDKKYDYSNKSETALERMLEKDSSATVEQATAAYNELKKRRGDMGFSITMILGGRSLDTEPSTSAVPVPPKKPAEPKMMGGGYAKKKKDVKAAMAYGGMANKKQHMYATGGMVKENPGLKALKSASPVAYNKITGK